MNHAKNNGTNLLINFVYFTTRVLHTVSRYCVNHYHQNVTTLKWIIDLKHFSCYKLKENSEGLLEKTK